MVDADNWDRRTACLFWPNWHEGSASLDHCDLHGLGSQPQISEKVWDCVSSCRHLLADCVHERRPDDAFCKLFHVVHAPGSGGPWAADGVLLRALLEGGAPRSCIHRKWILSTYWSSAGDWFLLFWQR